MGDRVERIEGNDCVTSLGQLEIFRMIPKMYSLHMFWIVLAVI